MMSTKTAGAALPRQLEPQLCRSAAVAPDGDDWLHEIKFDGYGLLCRKDGAGVRLFTRGGHDWTSRLPELAEHARAIPARSGWFDGELVMLDEAGMPDFEGLQRALGRGPRNRLFFHVWDAPFLEGADLTRRPLWERKEALARALAGAPARIRFTSHVVGSGPEVFERASEMALEGIVSKKVESRYRPGERGPAWVKVKCWRTYEVPLFGARLGEGGGIEALVVGTPEASEPAGYGGRVEFGLHRLGALRDALRAGGGAAPSPLPPGQSAAPGSPSRAPSGSARCPGRPGGRFATRCSSARRSAEATPPSRAGRPPRRRRSGPRR